jgi:hypothetical protein
MSNLGNATTLTAMEEWDLTKDLPAVDQNLGLEGITFISDDFLLSKKFVDEVHGKVYDPNDYPGHGNGLFFVGLEGMVKSLLECLNVETIYYNPSAMQMNICCRKWIHLWLCTNAKRRVS